MEMLPLDPDVPDPRVVQCAIAAFQRGELLVYPTDTLYALGGLAQGDVARRVRLAKGRDEGKPLPLIVADADAARALSWWTAVADTLAQRFWPGPLTLVLEATAAVATEITAGTGSVAIRVPSLAAARALCRGAGPLIATSANLAGEPAHDTCAGALAAVGGAAALALDAGRLPGAASTIVSVIGPLRLLRAGAISMEALQEALRESGAPLQTEP
jgi:L-threonylcarbamoyladenylate synthase